MRTAAFPAHEFHIFWNTYLRHLEVGEPKEENAVRYLRGNIFFINEIKQIDAMWRSAIDFVDYGFATYCSNTIENSWLHFKASFVGNYKLYDIATTLTELRDNIQIDLLAPDLKFEHVYGVLPPEPPNTLLLTGKGESANLISYPLRTKETKTGHRPREFNAAALYRYYQESGADAIFYRVDVSGKDFFYPFEEPVSTLYILPRYKSSVMLEREKMQKWAQICGKGSPK